MGTENDSLECVQDIGKLLEGKKIKKTTFTQMTLKMMI
jgi:hypothetical protein